ncbi:hypothetical protein NPIL_491021 [Nephila pilipes]|uniref:Uncharacterized protein n=1 Tax=Nephila pilipes TaxID=299642 RepID=A0A8X6NGJ4_NEPPI|nr:hypothetical protein NPIL_491021 [Nephila pilipes]
MSWSHLPFKLCETLDTDIQLEPEENQNDLHKTIKYVPVVNNIDVNDICKALVIDVLSVTNQRKLFVSKIYKKRAAKKIPVVQSMAVFKICEALNLPAMLVSQ